MIHRHLLRAGRGFTSRTVQQDLDALWDRVRWDTVTNCWVVVAGSFHPFGYGRATFQGVRMLTHRLVYLLSRGSLPSGELQVLHSCDVPACVNPDHLFEGTQDDNVQDCKSKGRLMHGATHYRAKLTEAQVRDIRETCTTAKRRSGIRKATAERLGISMSTVTDICKRKYWQEA